MTKMPFAWAALAVIYLLLLFYIASWGDRNSVLSHKITSHPAVYAFALAIYCTAWTFFGSVGQAAREQWAFLPILLGPILLYSFGYRFIFKLTLVSKKLHINTIADFIASRYGKRQPVALSVTLLVLLATIPYIALQIKAIGSMFIALTNTENSDSITIIATSAIALFAMYFGTRKSDVTEYRRGLMLAIAFESCIKLLALVCIAFVGYWVWRSDSNAPMLQTFFTTDTVKTFYSFDFVAQTFMAGAAIICLPRQFHIAIIDNLKLQHIATARWLFPLYLIAMAVTIPIIAAVGNAIFASQEVAPDSYVIALAIHTQSVFLKIIVFVGGLSAATAMIIVATLTMSTMLSNDVILPRLLTSSNRMKTHDSAKKIRIIRRIIIAVILFLAFLYHQKLANTSSLHSIGLVAFSLVIQLLPSIVGGLYWKRGHAHGVYGGLIVGVTLWFAWLVLPIIASGGEQVFTNTLLSEAAIISVLFNSVAYWLFSITAKHRLIDRLQAIAFVSPSETRQAVAQKSLDVSITNSDLITLLSTFLGEGRCTQLIEDFEVKKGIVVVRNTIPDSLFIGFCERALGGVIGASSAKTLIDSVIQGKKMDFTDVIHFFDDTAQTMQQNMTALITSMENMDQGMSVVDKNLGLVAWNKKYVKLYDIPEFLLVIGTPVEKIIRHNAEKGEFGPGDPEAHIEKRMRHLWTGRYHRFTRQRADGRVIEMIGNPLPGGGFVTSFTDITSFIETQKALEEAKIDLEDRVNKYTQEVHSINETLREEIDKRKTIEQELINAREIAEQANYSKTRFLALASHDIIQPLNAASLYASALQEEPLLNSQSQIVDKLSQSLLAGETLIRTLLDIARLDQGNLKAHLETVDLQTLLSPLLASFVIPSNEKKLVLKSSVHQVCVSSDPTFIYRIIQNLLSNAVKYTCSGRVLVRVSRYKESVRFLIADSGIGLSKSEQTKIFDDFYRADEQTENGVGLGLGVVKRLCELLNINLQLTSIKGQGTCFSFVIPLCEPIIKTVVDNTQSILNMSAHRVLCIDDDSENLRALSALLSKWNIKSRSCTHSKQAMEALDQFIPHSLLVDYQLGGSENGIELIQQIRERLGNPIFAVLVTASEEEGLKTTCRNNNIHLLNKPLKPAKLRALLQRVEIGE